jgi:hypothetical protein
MKQPVPPFATMPVAAAGAPCDREPAWSTASFGHAPDTSPLELSTLGDHLDRCSDRSGRWFVLRYRLEVVQTFVASHIVTTLVVALLVGALLLAV